MKLQFRINPVTLKELRQLVRSRLILWGMAVLPILLLVTTAIVLSSEMHDMSPMEVTYGKGLGGGPLIAVAVITGIVTCGLIPLFTSIKTAIETSKTSLGLEFTTRPHFRTDRHWQDYGGGDHIRDCGGARDAVLRAVVPDARRRACLNRRRSA